MYEIPDLRSFEPKTIEAIAAAVSMLDRKRRHFLSGIATWQAKHGEPGDWIECGVSRGGTAALLGIARTNAKLHGPLYLVDTWDKFPKAVPEFDGFKQFQWRKVPELNAIINGRNCVFRHSPEGVERFLSACGLDCLTVTGYFCDVLPALPGPFTFAHVDGDLYTSTLDALSHLLPRMTRDGVLILDDYGTDQRRNWPGVKAATDEILRQSTPSAGWEAIELDGVHETSALLTREPAKWRKWIEENSANG